MADKDHLQGEQLSMFMTARDLKNTPMSPLEVNAEVEWHEENDKKVSISKITKNLWKQKLSDSQEEVEPGGGLGNKKLKKMYTDDVLYDSIQKHGVMNPVVLGFTDKSNNRLWSGHPRVIIGGHHRIAAAHDINPDMEIPVQYAKKWYY